MRKYLELFFHKKMISFKEHDILLIMINNFIKSTLDFFFKTFFFKKAYNK